jgi:hypothetical protein
MRWQRRHPLGIGIVWKEAIASTADGHATSEGEEGTTLPDGGAHVVDRLRQRPTQRDKPAAIFLKRQLHHPVHLADLLHADSSNGDGHRLHRY